MNNLKAVSLASVSVASLMTAPVVASEAYESEPGFLPEEIVVTAQKREQSLQDVAIAVTAFDNSRLKALRIENSIDMIAYTPGVSMAGDIGGQRALFAIRGVVQNDFADHAEAPVAVYIDEGYLASTQAQTFGSFDINRVEILKGPQGTLFGRNATGGLVHSITNRPTDEFEGYAEFTYATRNQTRFEGALSGPLTDGVRGRVSMMYNHHDEIIKNVYNGTDAQGITGTPGGGQDGYNDDTFAARVQLEADLNDNATLLLIGAYADTTKSEGPYQAAATTAVLDAEGRHVDTIYARNDPNACEAISSVDNSCINLFADNDTDGVRPVVGGDLFGYVDPDGRGNTTNKDFAFTDQNKLKSESISAKLDWDLGWGDLFYMADFKNFSRNVGLDSDQGPTPLIFFQIKSDIDQMSHEFRLSGSNDKLDWVAGLYYLDISTDMVQGLGYPTNSPFLAGLPQIAFGLEGVVFDSFEDNTIADLDTQSYSVFGQLDYHFTDELTLTVGFRGGVEEKDYVQTIGEFINTDDRVIETETSNGFVPRAPFADSTSEFLWSGKAQLEYKPYKGLLYYAGVNRGVKAGSFNAKLFDGVTLPDEEIPYEKEVLWSYEAGVKASLFGGYARVNGSVFYYDYNDFQAFTWQNNSGYVTNNDAEYKGFELEATVYPAEGLDIITSLSYTDAEVYNVEVAPDIFRTVTPSFTPKWQASGAIRYGFDAPFGGRVTSQFSANYQSKIYHNLRNFTAHEFDSRTVANVSLTWVDDEERYRVSVFADNLFNSRHQVIGFDVSGFGGYTQESYAKPRWIGATIGMNF